VKPVPLVLIFLVFASGCGTFGRPDDSGVDTSPGSKSVTTNPDQAKFITSDIDNFWRALDDADTPDDYRTYRDEYLLQGSPGLREFSQLKIGGPRILAMKVRRYYGYYSSIRKETMSVGAQFQTIREAYRHLKSIYPDAVFPSVYFVIGSMNSGGIAAQRGLEIGTELFSKGPSTPLNELNPWEQSAVQSIDRIPQVVAHELIHFQQKLPRAPETLLERSIAEGSADFLSELIAGGYVNELQHRYGEEHEHVLWLEFRNAMHGKDISQWLYNGAAVAAREDSSGRPADLGYYVGYKICKAYYEKAPDKQKATREILGIRDFDQFYRESGYGVALASGQ